MTESLEINMTDQQKLQHFHMVRAIQHLHLAGLQNVSLVEVISLFSATFLGNQDKITEVLQELNEFEKTCDYLQFGDEEDSSEAIGKYREIDGEEVSN